MRLKTQQDKMTRLLELIKQATDVSDLLEIESEVADTQYEIDSLQSSLLTIDRDVDKSAVNRDPAGAKLGRYRPNRGAHAVATAGERL